MPITLSTGSSAHHPCISSPVVFSPLLPILHCKKCKNVSLALSTRFISQPSESYKLTAPEGGVRLIPNPFSLLKKTLTTTPTTATFSLHPAPDANSPILQFAQTYCNTCSTRNACSDSWNSPKQLQHCNIGPLNPLHKPVYKCYSFPNCNKLPFFHQSSNNIAGPHCNKCNNSFSHSYSTL